MTDVVLYNAMKKSITGEETFASALPLSLMALSSCLKQNGYTVKIIDGASERAEKIVQESLDGACIFGISCRTGASILNALKIAKLVREINPLIPIVWGGPHATLLPEQTISHPLVDIVCRGMGEETIVELVHAIKNKIPFYNIKGITYKLQGRIICNPERPMKDISLFPTLDYSAVDTKKYAKLGPIPYISSRGCPHRCTFCATCALYGRKWLSYPPGRVLKELENLIGNFGVKRVFFWDDNFFVNRKRVEQICDGLIDKNLNLKWSAFCRCDYFSRYDTKFLSKLKESGLEWISFGVESGSPRILDFIQKDITLGDIIKTVENCKLIQVDADFSFMSGFPTETLEDLKRTILLFDRMLSIYPEISIRLFSFNPFPGTQILKNCVDTGFELPNSLEEYGRFDYHGYVAPWIEKEHAKLIKTLVWLTSFLSEKSSRTGRISLDLILSLLHHSAKMRFKHKFFKLPVEFLLLRFLHRRYYYK